MRQQILRYLVLCSIASFGLLVNSTALAQNVEMEPNDSCLTAQDFGSISLPFLLNGELLESDGPDGSESEVDFYRFTSTSDTELLVELKGDMSGSGTLNDPFLGWFDSDCELQQINDDYNGLNSRLFLTVPANDVFIVAASSCCDSEFTGNGGGTGTYELRISQAPPAIGSISAQAVDAISGAPLPGEAPPFAYFTLAECDDDDCSAIFFGDNADSEGRVSFTSGSDGEPLRVGTYEVVAYADDYEMASSGPFTVNAGENFDVGTLLLNPPPISISDIEPCDTIPSYGGVCRYRAKINNNLPERLRGMSWSLVDAYGIGSTQNFTLFEATARGRADIVAIRNLFFIRAFDSDVVEFRFTVPASVADGAAFCTRLLVGLYPNPLLNTVQEGFLFCVEKNAEGYEVMSEQAARKLDNTARAKQRNTWDKP